MRSQNNSGLIALVLMLAAGLWLFPAIVEADDPPRQVNVPHFDSDVIFDEMAVFWFGKVTSSDNYADVRVGYNNELLRVNVAAFDRYLWRDTSPGADLDEWDGATLYLSLDSGGSGSPGADDYYFIAQVGRVGDRENYQKAFQGNAGAWVEAAIPFTTTSGWRGTDFNNNDNDDRGSVVNFYIPFAGLGLSGPPAEGTVWRLALALHDRDNAAGSPAIANKIWPENVQFTQPNSWGNLRFGLPVYSPSAAANQTVTIRHKLNNAVVVDAAVGGHTICGNGLDFWTEWGEKNYAGEIYVNVQNQSDIADWPCFSKYYITFPLDSLPANKVILSATLTLHHFGNSDPSQAQPSLIQVLTVRDDWDEETITWNNAPLAAENVSAAWVNPLAANAPTVARSWNVAGATAAAYANGAPLNLVLYSADGPYHSGKYFYPSDTGDWNEQARPTLTVILGNRFKVYLPFVIK